MVPERTCLIPGLPDEVAIVCLAKIPLLHRFCISRVCRGWRSLFREEYFWAVRREHSACETLLLVCTHVYKPGVWYGFFSATKQWMRLPPLLSDNREKGWCEFAAVDEKLFVMGGYDDIRIRKASSMVSYFDLKRWEWKQTAPLNIAREEFIAGALNGLLYVFGGVTDRGCRTPTVEVYNPVTKQWKFVSRMQAPLDLISGVVVDGKFYAVGRTKGVVYSPQEDEWTQMSEELNSGWSNLATEFNGKICIRRDSTNPFESCILGYDLKEKTWKLIHGPKIIEKQFLRRRFSPQYSNSSLGVSGEERLVNLHGTLCHVTRDTTGTSAKFEIKDLAWRCLASKSIPFAKLAGAEHCQIEQLPEQDFEDRVPECEVVRL